MKKTFLFLTIIAIAIISANGETIESSDKTPKVENVESCVSYTKKWNKDAKCYFLHFSNSCNKRFEISFEFYSNAHRKYIQNCVTIDHVVKLPPLVAKEVILEISL